MTKALVIILWLAAGAGFVTVAGFATYLFILTYEDQRG
jgi:hypothetical protein